jgi:hypothetical protein
LDLRGLGFRRGHAARADENRGRRDHCNRFHDLPLELALNVPNARILGRKLTLCAVESPPAQNQAVTH